MLAARCPISSCAEHDPLASDIPCVADGYKIKDGACSLPDAPGFGLAVNEEKFRQAKIHVDLKA